MGKTLGRLVVTLRASVRVPQALEGRLSRALVLRNWLAHEYFWDRSIDGMSFAGRAQMIDELDEVAEYFRSIDQELTRVSEAWLMRSGVSAEVVEGEMAAMQQQARARDLVRDRPASVSPD